MKKSLLILLVVVMTLLSGCILQYEEKEPALNSTIEKVSQQQMEAKVVEVTDGDTLVISPLSSAMITDGTIYSSEEIKIRLLLVDAPESTKEQMAYGKEASQFLKDLLEGQTITYAYDKGEREDKYGRQLCYVYLNGKMVQESLLENGLAIVRYVQHPNDTHLPQLKKAESMAKTKKLGVWSLKNYVQNGEYDKELGQLSQIDQLIHNVQDGLKDELKDTLEDEALKFIQNQLKP